MLSMLTDHFLLYVMKSNLSANPELAILASLDSQITLGILISASCRLR